MSLDSGFFIRLVFCILLIAIAIALGRAYEKYVRERTLEMRGYCDMLLHIKGQISRFLSPTSKVLSGFSSPIIEKSGFFMEFQRTGSLKEAFLGVKHRISGKFYELLLEFFSDFGREYKDGEIARCEHYIECSRAECEREERELSDSVRLVKTLLVAAALSITILVI